MFLWIRVKCYQSSSQFSRRFRHFIRRVRTALGADLFTAESRWATTGGSAEDKTYLINVARTADSDEPFRISMVFETPLDQQQLGVTDLLRLPLPRFEEGVKFQQVYVRVWVPKDYRLVGDPEGFTNHIRVGLWDSRSITHAPDNPDGWFPQDTSSFDFQVGGTTYLFSTLAGPTELDIDYWHIPTMTLIAGLIVLAIGVVLAPFSLDAKVFTILAAVLVVSFAGLFTPSIVNSWLLAARLGFAGVVALWLVVWLLFLRRTGRFQAVSAGRAFAGSGRDSKGTTELPPPPDAPPGGRKSPDSESGGKKTSATDTPGSGEASDDARGADEPEDTAGDPRRDSDDK